MLRRTKDCRYIIRVCLLAFAGVLVILSVARAWSPLDLVNSPSQGGGEDFTDEGGREFPASRIDNEGFWVDSPVMTSKAPAGGRYVYNFTAPFDGTVFHLGSSVHPEKDTESNQYVIETLWWIEDESSYPGGHVQGIIPDHVRQHSFECVFGRDVTEGVPIFQHRGEYLLVNCPLPSWAAGVQADSSVTARYDMFRRLRQTKLQLRIWAPSIMPKVPQAQIPMNAITRRVWMESSKSEVTEVLYLSHTISQWEAPDRLSPLTICTAPIMLERGLKISDVIEWRLWHLYQGVSVVHYYSRNAAFKNWLDRFNERFGLRDTYKEVPIFTPRSGHVRHYADQPHWMHDCILRHSFVDQYQAHVDIDEFLVVTNVSTQNALVDRVLKLDPAVSSMKFYQTYYGSERIAEAPSVEGFDLFPRNAYSHWTFNYYLAGARYTKAIHNPAGVETIWVHEATSSAPGYYAMMDDLDYGMDGLVQLHHSRRSQYQGIEYPLVNKWSIWSDAWAHMASQLEQCKDLMEIDV